MSEIKLRFAVVSDGHWGIDDAREGDPRYPEDEPTGLTYQETHDDAKKRLNEINSEREIDFIVLNGDNVHDDETLHSELHDEFTHELDFIDGPVDAGERYFGAAGNHDWSNESEWMDDYGHAFDYSFVSENVGFIITANIVPRSSDYRTAEAEGNVDYVKSTLDDFESDGLDGAFVFHHVPPDSSFDFSYDNPEMREQLQREIVSGCFLGHTHQYNDVVTVDGIKYINMQLIGNNRVYAPRGVRVFDITE